MDHSTGSEFYKCSQPIVASHVIGCPDAVDATGQRIVMYDIQDVTPEAHELGTVLLEAVEQVQEAVSGLRGLKYPMDGSCTPVHCVPVKR